MILHCDGNSFYASCEQIYRPDLRGKPVIVLSNNDGIIIALNKEAKDCGLVRGDVFFKVRPIVEQHNIEVFSSNYTLYADISRRITSIYMEYAPEIEEYSIDESFLFFNNCNWTNAEFEQIGFELKQKILKEVGIRICVGGAPTKTLAKLYNKNAKLHGGVFIYDGSQVDTLLEQTPCSKIWGIGRAKSSRLAQINVKNALELKHLSLDVARKLLTSVGVATVMELNGIPSIDRIVRTQNDVITTSKQFSKKVYDFKTLESAVFQYSQLVVEKLRKQKFEAGVVGVYISTCNYYCDEPELQYSNGIYMELDRMTSYTVDIAESAIWGLKKIYRQGYGYKTVMITLQRLLPACLQGNLFIDPMNDIKKRDLMIALDKINASYGRTTVSLAKAWSSGQDWEMKREYLSPCWTTRIKDVPRIK